MPKSFTSALIALFLLSHLGFYSPPTPAKEANGWHCGMKLCLCEGHSIEVQSLLNDAPVFDFLNFSASKKNATVFANSENLPHKEITSTSSAKYSSDSHLFNFKNSNIQNALWEKQTALQSLLGSDIIKPPQILLSSLALQL